MPRARPIQTNFNGGAWSPLLDGRVDLAKYNNAMRTMRNMVPLPHGPATRRPGTQFIAEVKDSTKATRLVPFRFSTTQAYALEFGDQYMRVYKDLAQVVSGGSAYEISTPYLEADLFELKFAQSADVLYIAHPDYAPRKLTRTGHTAWTLSVINFRPPALKEHGHQPGTTLTPGATTGTNITFTAGASAFIEGDVGRYITSGTARMSIVTYVSATEVRGDIIDDFASTDAIASGSWTIEGSTIGEISVDGKDRGKIITASSTGEGETFTDLLRIASNDWIASGSGTNEYYLINSAPQYQSSKPSRVYENDELLIEGTIGSLGIKQWDWGDNDSLGYSTIYIRLSDGTDPDSKAAGGADYVQCSDVTAASALFRSADVGKYLVMLGGLVKITAFTSATAVSAEVIKTLLDVDDDAFDADATAAEQDTAVTKAWTMESDAWSAALGWPSCVVFHEERLYFAGSTTYPQTIWGSVIGDYENITPGVADDDSVEYTIASREVNVIRWLESKGTLVVGTVGGEWKVGSEDLNTPLSPTNVYVRPQTNIGSADLSPITIGEATLFWQSQARKLRELVYRFESDSLVAPDLSLLAEHLMIGGIVDMAYQKEPYSILWCVRADGTLLGLTYLREQEVVAWHEHTTDGTVESVACIPGDGYDELWMVVNRTINGSTVRYVEVMQPFFTDDSDTYQGNNGLNLKFLDCALTYNGAATSTISGLDHLEGEAVSIIADGGTHADKTVSGGQVTLDYEASVVHVGLNCTPVIETLRPDAGSADGTSQGRTKRTKEVTLRFHNSAPDSVLIGPSSAKTERVPYRTSEMLMDVAPELYSGDITRPFPDRQGSDGRIYITQDKSLPLTLVAIIRDMETKA